jgi:hypothetical protein
MPFRFEANDIAPADRSLRPGRRDRPSGASSSAARLAAEAAFDGGSTPGPATEQRPVTVVHKKAHARSSAPAGELARTAPEAPVETRSPRVFRVASATTSATDGTGPSDTEETSAPADPAAARRRRSGAAALSGPVTVVMASPAIASKPPSRGKARAAVPDKGDRRKPAVPDATLDELARELSSASAALEALRRTPAPDFRVQPDEAAWERLSKAADKLLKDIGRIKPRRFRL